MDNYQIADQFSLLSKLMDIHGENSFRAKSYSIAAYNIERLPAPLSALPSEEIFSIKGIGESMGKKIIEIIETGALQSLNDIIGKTPPGVLEMLNIKGIGPKKISAIWKEMEIESIGELLYACNENRLTLYKGFGEKTQQNIQEAIEFYMQNQGHFLYAEAEALYEQIDAYLRKLFPENTVHITGAYRRQELIIEQMEFVILESNENIKPKFQTTQPPELVEETDNTLVYKLKNGLKLKLYTGNGAMDERLFYTTGSEAFILAFKKAFPDIKQGNKDAEDDTIIFNRANISFVPPCMRESAAVIETARKKKLPELIMAGDIKSIIHCHSNWSDGTNAIEEMAEALIAKGYEYMVLSDHSKSAFYANGLTEERIKEQHRYIDELNRRLDPFRIFKSIECDILNDGKLDYTDSVLSTFDLVIASVHSNLKMTEDKAMHRLQNALANPYVTILGHMTGRLLLSRNGYPVDHEKIIDTCAEQHVVIELNAHPRRLDIDWKYIDLALQKGVLISINPDAHALEGFEDVKYGVLAAQKAGLTKEKNLSSFSLNAFEKFINARKKLKGI